MNRAQLITSLEDIIDMVKDSNEKGVEPVYFIPETPDLPEDEKNENEYDKLGFFVSSHPLDNYRIKLSELPTVQDLDDRQSGESVILAGLMMDGFEKVTKSGSKMGVFILEDLTGRVEVVVFGKAVNDFRPFLNKKTPAIQITGRLDIQEREMDEGEIIRTPKVMLNKITSLEETEKIEHVTIHLTKRDNLQGIYNLLKENPGDIKVSLEFEQVVFGTAFTLNQERDVLRQLNHLCHFESQLRK